jgi:hypothetical protein
MLPNTQEPRRNTEFPPQTRGEGFLATIKEIGPGAGSGRNQAPHGGEASNPLACFQSLIDEGGGERAGQPDPWRLNRRSAPRGERMSS